MTLAADEPAAGPWRVAPLSDLVAVLLGASGLLVGRPRIIAIDGRSRSGKTMLAERLRTAVPGAEVVHTDDIAWWHSRFGWCDLIIDGVLETLHGGQSVHYQPPAWRSHRRAGHIDVPAKAPVVIIEGVGAARRELTHLLDAGGREVLRSLTLAEPTTIARRSARARALLGPRVGKALGVASVRPPRPVVEDDPRTDTRAAAAHIIGILWVTASQGATVKELRAATGMTRERLEAAYEYLLEQPPLGLAVQRQRDDLFLVSAAEVAPSIERHLGNPRSAPLSNAALQVLAIVAYKQPITRAGIDRIRGSTSDGALDTLLVRGLVKFDQRRLLVTTRAFLDLACLRDLADLPPLPDLAASDQLNDVSVLTDFS